jgi:hypothetical protein
MKNTSWLGSLINTIIGNLKLSISNIHIRYEDLERYSSLPSVHFSSYQLTSIETFFYFAAIPSTHLQLG